MEEVVSAIASTFQAKTEHIGGGIIGMSLGLNYGGNLAHHGSVAFVAARCVLVAPRRVISEEEEFAGQLCGIVAEDERRPVVLLASAPGEVDLQGKIDLGDEVGQFAHCFRPPLLARVVRPSALGSSPSN